MKSKSYRNPQEFPPLTPSELGQASVLAAETLLGVTYPPHSLRLLARAYIQLLDKVQAYRDARGALDSLPCSVRLPERMIEEAAKYDTCQHGALPAADGRPNCIACVWMEDGKLDAAFNLCEHDRRRGSCERGCK